MKPDQTSEATPEGLKNLLRGLEAETEELLARRAELNLQLSRVNSRLRWVCKMQGIAVPQPRARKILGKIAIIERLINEAHGPMTLESICRELEVAGGKATRGMRRESVHKFLRAHPRVFIEHGPDMWDLRAKHVAATAAWTDKEDLR